jgi:hypothetical protein
MISLLFGCRQKGFIPLYELFLAGIYLSPVPGALLTLDLSRPYSRVFHVEFSRIIKKHIMFNKRKMRAGYML